MGAVAHVLHLLCQNISFLIGMCSMQLTLLVPGLSWARDDDLTSLLAPNPLPGLNQLYRFAKRQVGSVVLSEWYQSFLPNVSLLAQAKTLLKLPEEGNYGLASPITLRLNRDSITLADGGVLNLTMAEAQSFAAILNEFLRADGWCFYPLLPDLWVWQSQAEVEAKLNPLCDVVGKNIEGFLPQGRDALSLMSLLTEVQMFLFAHAKNTERQKQGLPMINGLWLWQDLPVGSTDLTDTLVFTDQPWWQIMVPCLPAPDRFSTYLQWCELHQPKQQKHVILLEDILSSMQYQDVWGYQAMIQSLDERFFVPIWQALRSGSLNTLYLCMHGENGGGLRVHHKSHWAFWRRNKPLFSGKLV